VAREKSEPTKTEIMRRMRQTRSRLVDSQENRERGRRKKAESKHSRGKHEQTMEEKGKQTTPFGIYKRAFNPCANKNNAQRSGTKGRFSRARQGSRAEGRLGTDRNLAELHRRQARRVRGLPRQAVHSAGAGAQHRDTSCEHARSECRQTAATKRHAGSRADRARVQAT
jgi:hypothetical protein